MFRLQISSLKLIRININLGLRFVIKTHESNFSPNLKFRKTPTSSYVDCWNEIDKLNFFVINFI